MTSPILEAVRGDIASQQVDAIVNAANPSLLGGGVDGGVDGAIPAPLPRAPARSCASEHRYSMPVFHRVPSRRTSRTARLLHA